MPKYGRSLNKLTKQKPKSKSKEAVLKRGNNPRAWNLNLGMKKRNPNVYIDPFRSRIRPHTPIIPPNMKFRLQTFFLSAKNLMRNEVFFRRPGGGVSNQVMPVAQCAEIYKRILDMMRRTAYWGENLGLPTYFEPINDVAPLVEEGEVMETPPGVEGVDQPVADESGDEVMDGEDLDKSIDLDVQHLSMNIEGPTEEFAEEPEEIVEEYSDNEYPDEEEEAESDYNEYDEDEESIDESDEVIDESDDVIDDSDDVIDDSDDVIDDSDDVIDDSDEWVDETDNEEE